MGKERKSIIIFGIIMAFILGSLVSGPFATAQMGTPFLDAEIKAIEEIVAGMQDQLNNIKVAWENVTHTPPGFAKDINTLGIFQGNTSSIVEPCNAGDVVTWNATHWVCDAIGGVASNVVVLHYEQTELEILPLTPALGDPVLTLLAEWEIVKDVGFEYADVATPLFDSSVFADINGGVQIGWYKFDGTIWKPIVKISEANTAFEVKSRVELLNHIFSETTLIAFAATNPFPDASSKVKDFSGTTTIHLPPGQSLNKICCPP